MPARFSRFDDVGAFILTRVDITRRMSQHWHAIRRDLALARFGAGQAQVHQALRMALKEEGSLQE